MLASSALTFVLVSAVAAPVRLCSVGELRQSPDYRWRVERVATKVDSATQIVRARAVDADSAKRIVTFEPLEWIRGAPPSPRPIVLPGVAVARSDFNDLPVPYQMVRPAGRRGDCYALEYRLGREYLLLLRDGQARSPIAWWPLGPVNEELRGENDPWAEMDSRPRAKARILRR